MQENARPSLTQTDEGPPRRARLTRELRTRTGIDEAMIERLVHRFYDRVRADPLLAPIFVARIADWGPHLEKMRAFWSSVALMTGRYHGQPVVAHRDLPIGAGHFDRWLALFRETATAECPPVAAGHFIERAERIAESLELSAAVHRGDPLPPPRTQPSRTRARTLAGDARPADARHSVQTDRTEGETR